ncbi:MAG: hypothetical protein H8D67_15510 [Deltaproteobacteria bacterium]|nr:hypothetical protein [Deltaproteobacteria bacterium]
MSENPHNYSLDSSDNFAAAVQFMIEAQIRTILGRRRLGKRIDCSRKHYIIHVGRRYGHRSGGRGQSSEVGAGPESIGAHGSGFRLPVRYGTRSLTAKIEGRSQSDLVFWATNPERGTLNAERIYIL